MSGRVDTLHTRLSWCCLPQRCQAADRVGLQASPIPSLVEHRGPCEQEAQGEFLGIKNSVFQHGGRQCPLGVIF